MVVATVLRRNWHLLAYEQLLPLIGMSRAELSYSLREDDFLFQKMARIARSEARLARALDDLALDDSRIGFESSNQYYYMPLDLVEKVVNCESIAAGLVGHSTKP